MPLVFVHGVNVRRDPEGRYDAAEELRNRFFEESVLRAVAVDPEHSRLFNPYWGAEAAQFPWQHAALPETEYEVFGANEGLAADEVLPAVALARIPDAQLPADGAVLPWLARQSFESAVDLLIATAADRAGDQPGRSELAVLTRQVGQYAYLHRESAPAWLDGMTTNEQFVDRLIAESEPAPEAAEGGQWETFGRGIVRHAAAAVRKAGDRIGRASRNLGRSQFRKLIRDPVNHTLSQFIGDILVYTKTRDDAGTEAPIVKTVIEALYAADRSRSGTSEPLIVVAHSMGGNIVYDILTEFGRDIRVDVLVTVGSQVGVFEELKLFKASDRSVPNSGVPRVTKPDNVGKWLNVFDHNDILGFAARRIFDGVDDFEYDTGGFLYRSHNAYFTSPSFHHRLAMRVQAS